MRINWQFIRRLRIVCTTVAIAGLAGGLYTQFTIIAVVVGAAAFQHDTRPRRDVLAALLLVDAQGHG